MSEAVQETQNEDIGDFELDESAEQEFQANAEDDSIVKIPKEEWESVRSASEEYAREKAYNSTVEAIKREIKDFDASKVVAKLQELHKSDPTKAQAYNNEIGFKLLWREMTDDVAKNDAVNGGSNKSSGNDFHSVLDDAMMGKHGALKKALSMAI